MIRSLLERFRSRVRNGQQGYTLVEVIASVVILGIIIVPLGTAMVVGFRTVVGIQERLAGSADVQQLSTYFPSDVASVDSDGVNPTTVDDEGVCAASATEQWLITFRWDQDLGEGGQTVVRYLARGHGIDSELVRRVCRGSAPAREVVLAKHFGMPGSAEAASYLIPEGKTLPTPECGTRLCSVDIHGQYDFHLDAQRRVEGESGSIRPPGAPTNVHALSGFNRVRLFWNAPLDDGGGTITGYYVEQQPPNQLVGGDATPTLFAGGTPPGALIDGLANDQTYIFRVRAVTSQGNGPWSAWSPSVTPGPSTPEPPKLDLATGDPAINGRVNATWSLPSDYSDGGSPLTGFRLTANDPDSTPTVVTYNNPATLTGSVTGLQDNTRYSVLVTALNSYGEGSPSASIDDVLTLPGPPGTPTASGSGTAGTVVLTFAPPSEGEFTDFTNFRAKVGSTNSAPVAAATACPTSTSCTLTVSGVNVSSSTTVYVQAQNATGWGTLSAPLTIPADTTPPTVAVTFPSKPAYNGSAWDAGCGAVGGAVCGTASDGPPGAVASVTLTVRRLSDNKYWNGSAGTGSGSGQPWNSSAAVNLAATGTTDWSRPLTTASLTNGETYTIVATAKDSLNQSSTATRTFAYVTGAPTGSITAPANNSSVRGTVTVTSNSAATSPAVVESAAFEYKPNASSTWTSIGIDVAGPPWSAAWDTSLLTNGLYDLRVRTTDNASNSFTSLTVTVTVDNTAPTGNLTAPADGALVRGSSVTVSSNSADTGGAGVADATFQRSPTGAGTWTTIGVPDTSSPYSVAWNTTSGTPDGVYDLRVVTTDNAGNSFTSPTRTVTVDNTGPSITPNVAGTLGTNGWYTSNVNVSWTVTDPGSGIATSTGCGVTNITTNTTGQLLTCSATDNAGNTTNQPITIKRDAAAPTGNLTAPTNGVTVSGTVTVSSDSADTGGSNVANATFQFSPAGLGTWTTIGAPDTSSPYSVSWNTAPVTQGSYDLRVVTTDNAGLSFTSPIRTVFVDSVAPTVTITKPGGGSAYNAAGWALGCVTNNVCGTASDAAPGTVTSVTLTVFRASDNRYWNGVAGITTTQWLTTPTNLPISGTTAAWNRALTTASLQNNVTYTMVATATDSSGLTGTDTNVFVYDTTLPSGTVTAPANGANVKGSVNVTSNSADTGSAGVASAAFEYRVLTTGPWTAIGSDTTSPYSVAWDTTLVPDGQYYLRVTTTDNAGNVFSSADTLVRPRVDNGLPTGSLTAPANGASVRGNAVTVSSDSADTGGSGVANATFQRSPTGAGTWTTIGVPDTTSPYSVTWNTTSGTPDGVYDLRVVTTDNAGNAFTSPIRTVTVDNTAPSILGNASGTVGNNGWYVTNVALTWTVTETGSGIASSTGCGPSNVIFDTPVAGTTFTCSATDNAGNSSNGSVTIKRDATPPTGDLTGPANGAIVKGTIGVFSNSADPTSGVASARFERAPTGTSTWTIIGTDLTPSMSVNWNTTSGTPDGVYDLRVVTTDNAGITFTSPIRTVTVDNTKPVPSSFSLSGPGGAAGNGTVASGDQIRIGFSETIKVNTLCTTWSGDASNQSTNVTVTMVNNSNSDYLTLPSPCANIATGATTTIDTNANYLTTTRTFSSSTVAWNAATRELTITLGTPSGSVSSGASNTVPTYTPTANIADLAGNTTNATGFNGTSSRF